MTLKTILKAAVSSMITGHHKPHCFSAHVQGQGYVNDGSEGQDRADYLRQLERAVQNEIDDMGYASEYAEKGYDKPRVGILLANWNRFPSELDTILASAGYMAEWSDEWFVCDCMRAVRTEPASYDWAPGFKILDNGEIFCIECAASVEGE